MYYDNVINKPPLDEIYHHGIKGQKWGVKNGPPYPLDSSKSTGSRLKTNEKQGLSALAVMAIVEFGIPAAILGLTQSIRAVYTKVHLSSKQKAEYIKNKAKQQKLKDLRNNTEVDKETGLRLKKNKNSTMEEDMDAVNFYRGQRFKSGRTYTNCAYCTTAYDLRRRGFEVRAKSSDFATHELGGVTNEQILSWYKNPKKVDFKLPEKYDQWDNKTTASVIKKELLKQPDGSRGNMCVRWKYGGGHSVAYEIKNKKVIILDTQANQKYEGKEVDKFLNTSTLYRNPWFMRTDNLEPNYKLLKKKGVIE